MHRIRMGIEAKANNCRLFLGGNGGPLILCIADELIRAGWASVTLTLVLFNTVLFFLIFTLSGGSVVASRTSTLKDARSNLHEIFKFFH